jgi:hypothetical protein
MFSAYKYFWSNFFYILVADSKSTSNNLYKFLATYRRSKFEELLKSFLVCLQKSTLINIKELVVYVLGQASDVKKVKMRKLSRDTVELICSRNILALINPNISPTECYLRKPGKFTKTTETKTQRRAN